MRRFLFLAVLLTPLLAACGPPLAWTKPGVSAREAAQDSDYCRQAAWREAWMMERSYRWGAFGPRPFYDPYRRQWVQAYPYGSGLAASDPFHEMRLQNFCMRAKGYALTPIPQSGG